MSKTLSRQKFVKVFAAATLSLTLAFGLAACSSNNASTDNNSGSDTAASTDNNSNDANQTVSFTDSAGRTVEIPANVTAIVPSGHTANQVLLTIAPEKMVGLSQELSDDQKKYLGDRVSSDLPVLGAIFGAKGDLNKEEVAATGAQLLIDTGEYKDGIADDLDALQEELGIPCIFIESSLDKWGDAYRALGQVLGEEDRGEELATYCDNAYKEVSDVMSGIADSDRVGVIYCTGDSGTNVIANGSFQANVVDMVANNVAVVDSPSGKGSGNESSLEQIANWNPTVVLFQEGSVYDSVGSDAAWQALPAIQNGSYYEVPGSPWCWLNSPPTINQVMGMQWLPRILYPDAFQGKDSLEDVVKSYYKTFYGYDLSDDDYNSLIAKAAPQA